jgi:hypothetical protein
MNDREYELSLTMEQLNIQSATLPKQASFNDAEVKDVISFWSIMMMYQMMN